LIPFFEPAYPFIVLCSLQALSLKNHDYSYLRKFWSFGIVLGMGAQLSVAAHNKCGCAHTCWFLELLICIPRWDFKIFASLHVFCVKKREERKQKENKIKENKE